MDRLTKWDPDHGWVENHDNDTREWKNGSKACMEKLGRLEDAQEQGRLVELPLPLGAVVYEIYSPKKNVFKIRKRTLYDARITEDVEGVRYCTGDNEIDEIFLGKLYFSTRAEAEAALAAQEEK